jgi:hypothetical protein
MLRSKNELLKIVHLEMKDLSIEMKKDGQYDDVRP